MYLPYTCTCISHTIIEIIPHLKKMLFPLLSKNASTFEPVNNLFYVQLIKQKGQRCPKRQVVQAAIRLATAVITFRNKERKVRSPS